MANHCALADGGECIGTDGTPMPRGGRFVAASIVVFILPLVTGIIASQVFAAEWAVEGHEGWWELAGMTAGVAVGVLVGRWLVRVLKLHQSPTDTVEET